MNSCVDKNLITKTENGVNDLISFNLPCNPFDQYGGIFYDKEYGHFLRMEKEIADKMSWGLNVLKHMTPGGRTRFSTDATYIEIEVEYDDLFIVTTMPLTSSSGFLLVEDKENGYENIHAFRPDVDDKKSFKQSVSFLKKEMRYFTLWWPIYNKIKSVKISFNKDAKVGHGRKYKDISPILYYGSSITQGCCASRCDSLYEGLICHWSDVDFVNFGFSGNAFGEIEMAKYLAKRFSPSIFVMDYDWNAENAEALRKTHLPFYLEFRKYHKNTPIILMSMPMGFDNTENGGESSLMRKNVILNTIKYAKEHGDDNIYFIDGESCFPSNDKTVCTLDNCHPNDLGFYFIAKKLYEIIEGLI